MRTIHVAASLLQIADAADGIFIHNFSVDQMFGDDSVNLIGGHFNISRNFSVGLIDLDDGLILAQPDAAGLCDHDILQTTFGDLFGESREDGSCACRDAAGSHADDDTDIVRGIFFPKMHVYFLRGHGLL